MIDPTSFNNTFNYNQFDLARLPKSTDKSLQAWNAADLLLIEYILENNLNQSSSTLIINDQFGALSVALNTIAPFYWSDSYLSNQSIKKNLETNYPQQIKAKPLNFELLENNPTTFDLVLIRIPKHNSLLSYQLEMIKPWIHSQTKIISAGMTKEIHNSNLTIFNSLIGKTVTSLAKKKARLIFSEMTQPIANTIHIKQFHLKSEALDVLSLPGVFSRDKLDIGTRVLLDYLPTLNENETAIDLGCGNGVIGAILAKRYPSAKLLLTDESQVAIKSAQLTFNQNHLTNGIFVQTDVLDDIPFQSAGHILCNPPFHQQNVQTLDIANKMFKQAAFHLHPFGELRVIANRHLKYLPMLKKFFRSVSSISNDPKFTVWLAKQPIHVNVDK